MIDIIELETKTPIEIKYQTLLQEKPARAPRSSNESLLWLLNVKRGEIIYVSHEGIKIYLVSEP